MKRLKAMGVICLVGLMLTGCIPSTPLDEYGYVLSIGVDKGEQKKYSFSFLIQQEGNSQENENGAGGMVLSAEGNSIFEAISTAELGQPYALNFKRTNYIAFALDAAKCGLMEEFLDISFVTLKIRQSVKLIVTLGESKEYLEGLNSKQHPNVAKRQYGLFQNYSSEGVIPMTNLALFFESVSGRRSDPVLAVGALDLSIPPESEDSTGGGGSGGETGGKGGKGGEEQKKTDPAGTTTGVKRTGGLRSYSKGCAIFDGMKLVGILDGGDTEMILIARGLYEQGGYSYEDEQGFYSFHLSSESKPKIKLTLGDEPRGTMDVILYFRMEMDTSRTARNRWEEEVKPTIENYLAAELQRVFKACQSLNSDAFALGKQAAVHFTDAAEWEVYNWKEKYPLLQMDFRVCLRLEDANVDITGE